MSRRRKPDIVFTEPVQHHQSPRDRLYNSRRRKNVKRGFGTASLVLGVIALLAFVFPLIDLPIGVLGVILACVAYGIKTDGRDIGHHLATAGMAASIASLIFTGAFWVMNRQLKAVGENEKQTEQTKLVQSLTGVWRSESREKVSIEFTPGGNLIYSELESTAEDAKALKETAGLFQVDAQEMKVAFGAAYAVYKWEILPGGELRVMSSGSERIRLPFAGKWRKTKTLKNGLDYDSASPKMKKYLDQLDGYTERKKELIGMLVKYTDEQKKLVVTLNAYQSGDKERDDQWRVLGTELKAVNGHVEKIESRIKSIDGVIVRLQGVIRNEGRSQDIARLDMTDDELLEILKDSNGLEDELKMDPTAEVLDDLEVEEALKNAAKPDEEVPNSSNDSSNK